MQILRQYTEVFYFTFASFNIKNDFLSSANEPSSKQSVSPENEQRFALNA